MKKSIILVFILSISVSLFGCDNSSTPTTTNNSSTPTTTMGDEQYYNLLISQIQSINYQNSSTSLPKIAEYLDLLPDSYSDVASLRQQYTEVNAAFSKRVNLSIDTPYTDLFAFYSAVKIVDDKFTNWNFADMYEKVIELLFFGSWSSGTYTISRQRVYSDYANTKSSDWFSNNLPNSKIYGTSYYYYNYYNNHKMIVGYLDRITNEKTDNYQITFSASSISVYSLIENKTYTMSRDLTYSRVVRDNAKMAYEYIARIVSNFKDPQSLIIRKCMVYSEEGYVIIETSAANSVGGIVIKTYKVSKFGNYYSVTEASSIKNSNIDVDELNIKIKAYIDSIY